MKIIAIHFAGGNKFSFREFIPFLPPDIDFITLELPGRGKRILEPLLSDTISMTNDLYNQMLPHIDSPYIIFGHSMGGMLGNLLIHQLNANNKLLPFHFFASGCSGPKEASFKVLRHLLNDNELKNELKTLGGLPDNILENDELMDFFLPIIRQDMRAIEQHIYSISTPYDVNITVFAGTNERFTHQQLLAWQYETTQDINIVRLEGNHFFLYNHIEFISTFFCKQIENDSLLIF
jgi:surfactin synthase thioesterase subunit